MRVLWAVAVVLWAGAGWAEDVIVTQEGNTTYITTVGNLAPDRDPGCIGLTEVDGALSPPDLFLGVIHCLKEDRAADAADLLVLIGLRARFDTLRVTDKTAHDASSVLALQLHNSLLPENLDALQAATGLLGGPGTPNLATFCDRLRATGVPAHDPGYMISHGMGAFVATAGPPLVENFDVDGAWRIALDSYVHCPG